MFLIEDANGTYIASNSESGGFFLIKVGMDPRYIGKDSNHSLIYQGVSFRTNDISSYAVSKLEISKEQAKAILESALFDFGSLFSSIHEREFVPGVSRVDYGGRIFDQSEFESLIGAVVDFNLTAGKYESRFIKKFKKFFREQTDLEKKILPCLVNSGSSANLLAMSALCSRRIGSDRINNGEEVICVAAGFPTSVFPILQNHLVPVFVDIDQATLNIDISKIERSITSKTRAIFLAHTLGIPFNINEVLRLCEKYSLFLIEDNCDALGAAVKVDREYKLPMEHDVEPGWHPTGTVGHLGTSSFYPAHHITMGEGGAVYCSDPNLFVILRSLRDWGRDCWCEGGSDNTCGKRFTSQFGLLPAGFDHKYTYSEIGYNLKLTDLQASVGCAQLDKLDLFVNDRRTNWRKLAEIFEAYGDCFKLTSVDSSVRISPFGFSVTVNSDLFTRDMLVEFLENKKIQTRSLFAGNLLRHPAICTSQGMLRIEDSALISGVQLADASLKVLEVTERVVRDTFWLGVFSGIKDEHMLYISEALDEFMSSYVSPRC